MINIVDLRHHTEVGTGYTKDALLCRAADEIERLRILLRTCRSCMIIAGERTDWAYMISAIDNEIMPSDV